MKIQCFKIKWIIPILLIAISYGLVHGQSNVNTTRYDSLNSIYDKWLKEENPDQILISAKELFNSVDDNAPAEYFYDSRSKLIYAHIIKKDYEQAVNVGKLAIEDYQAQGDTLQLTYLEFLNNYGFALQYNRSYNEAITYYNRVVYLDTILGKSEDESHFVHLNNLCVGNVKVGNYNDALQCALKAESGTKEHYGIEHPRYVSRLNSVALQYKRAGRLEESLNAYLQAADIAITIKGNDHKDVGLIYSNLTGLYLELNRYEEAKEAIHKSMQNAMLVYGEGSDRYFKRKMKLAAIERELGEYISAIETYYTIYDHYFETDKTNDTYAIAASSLAMIYSKLGQGLRAIKYQKEATEITSRVYGANHIYTSIEYNNLGHVESMAGILDSAILHFSMALEIEKLNREDKHWRYGLYLHNLSSANRKSGNFQEARFYADSALVHTAEKLGVDHNDYAFRLNNLGLIDLQEGRIDECIVRFSDALKIFIEKLGPNHTESLNTYHNLARAYEVKGLNQLASENYNQVSNILDYKIMHVYPSLSDEERILFWESLSSKLSDVLGFCYLNKEERELIRNAYDIHLKTKGLSLKLNMEQKSDAGDDIAIATLNDSLSQQKQILNNAFAENSGTININLIQDKISNLESRIAIYNEELYANSISERKYSSVLNSLNDDDLIIDIGYLQRAEMKGITSTEFYFAMIYNKVDVSPKMIKLASKSELQEKLGYDLNAQTSVKDLLNEYFLSFLNTELKDDNLIISPAGDYHYLPYSCIPILAADYSDHAVRIVLDLNDIEKGNQNITSLTLFGGPDYDLSIERWEEEVLKSQIEKIEISNQELASQFSNDAFRTVDRSSAYFQPLEGSLIEIQGIEKIMFNAQDQVKSYTGSRALEENFKQLDQSATDVIHLATHGFSFPYREIEGYTPQNMREQVILSENPLFRSGLAMTGANNSWTGQTRPSGIEDGILTAFEISELDLSGCQLVVLSACESGLGNATYQEGVFGLSRSFKAAGVNKMILSLWKVPDKETAELMILFYENISNGASILKAFYQAQSDMSKKYPARSWAGFILVE